MQSDFLESYLGVRVNNGFFHKLRCDELCNNSETFSWKRSFSPYFQYHPDILLNRWSIPNPGGKLFVI